jgi:hypothetical protein
MIMTNLPSLWIPGILYYVQERVRVEEQFWVRVFDCGMATLPLHSMPWLSPGVVLCDFPLPTVRHFI